MVATSTLNCDNYELAIYQKFWDFQSDPPLISTDRRDIKQLRNQGIGEQGILNAHIDFYG
jgi:hypothetical protein